MEKKLELMAKQNQFGNVLVLAPASGKETWRIEEQVAFKNPGNVFIVNSSKDLDKAIALGSRYTVVSHELLSRAKDDKELYSKLDSLIGKNHIIGGGIDEIDNFSNPKAKSTQVVLDLLSKIRQNYRAMTGKEDAPVIGITATPIKTCIEDLNAPMAMLYPDEYVANIGEATESKKTFSDACLRNPELTYINLIGNRKIFRWERASGVQKFEYQVVPVEVSPFERYLYDFIEAEVGGDALNKIRLLENALFNPLLVKAELRRMLNGKIPEIDLDEVLESLKKITSEWKTIKGIDHPQNENDYLSTDQLVQLGHGRMVLSCLTSGVLESGIDTLVEELTRDANDQDLIDLRLFWKKQDVSIKYQAVKKLLDESLAWRTREDGILVRDKVIIVSPSRRQGRTRDVLQKSVQNGDGKEEDLYESYEIDRINDLKLVKLVKEWVKKKGFSEESVLLLDGQSAPVGRKRNAVIKRWVDDPNITVLAETLEASYQSRDFTINALVDDENREIEGVRTILLGPPWHFQQLRQHGGRSQRQGQLVPVKNIILESEESVEVGKNEGIRYTRLLSGMVLSGIPLSKEDREFMDSKRVGARILRTQDPESRFFRDVLKIVKGAGEEKVEELMNSKDKSQEKNNSQRFAERFFNNGRDEFSITGHNAELVASLIKEFGLKDGRILSLGAGTLLLQRKLEKGIDNVDLNQYMMEAGLCLANKYGGRMITTCASKLDQSEFPDESYDYIDSAFALHWSKLGNMSNGDKIEDSERVKILSQINRLLKFNGKFILTLPEKAFDDEKFQKFLTVLESHLGFAVDRNHSGKSFGIRGSGFSERLGWCIVASKTGKVDLSRLKLEDLGFCYDNRFWVSEYDEDRDGISKNGKKDQGENPRIKFDYYKIINPSEKVETVDTVDIVETPPSKKLDVQTFGIVLEDEKKGKDIKTIPVSEIGPNFLRGNTKEEFDTYRGDLLRPLMRAKGLNWEEAEELATSLLQKLIESGRIPRNRVTAYSWILKEAKKDRVGMRQSLSYDIIIPEGKEVSV